MVHHVILEQISESGKYMIAYSVMSGNGNMISFETRMYGKVICNQPQQDNHGIIRAGIMDKGAGSAGQMQYFTELIE